MARITVAVELPRSPAEVWRHLERIETHVQWMAEAESIEFTSPATSGVGTTFVCVTRIGPVRLSDEMEITEWKPSETMGVRHVGVVSGDGRFVLSATASGTHFEWTEDLSFPWWLGGRVGAWLGRPLLRSVWRRNLDALRAQLA